MKPKKRREAIRGLEGREIYKKKRKQVTKGRKMTERYRRINGEISVDKRNIITWRSKE